MKIGIVSDIHGNLTGLDVCLEYLHQMNVDTIVSLGDVVGYFPDPSNAILRLREHGVHCLLGNHDAMLLGTMSLDKKKDRVYQIEVAKESVSGELKNYISTWLPWYEMKVGDKKLLFVHGSPSNPLNGYIYPDSDINHFKNWNYDAIFMGHTHRPFIKKIQGEKLAINVGSCGLPRDHGGLASCAIYDTNTHSCEIYRPQFNVNEILFQYEDKIHDAVVMCLKRKCDHVFGRIIYA